MITRKEFLSLFDAVLTVLSDIRDIAATVPDYETLLLHLHAFKCFIEKNSDHE